MEVFDVMNVRLAGRNMVEASAGTGKTYSIAAMVLRLILEQDIPAGRILMVTFTKSAVAELESRVRMFIRHAYRYSLNTGNTDNIIMQLVDRTGRELSAKRLRRAVESLDELAVMTIHSFCEQSLMQYPFETSQPFRFEIAPDVTDILDQTVNEYWRKKITVLDKDLFRVVSEQISRRAVREVLKKGLDGRKYICGNTEATIDDLKRTIELKNAASGKFHDHVKNNLDNIKNRKLTGFAKKFVDKNSGSYLAFIDAYIEGFEKKTQYIETSFPQEYNLCKAYMDQKVALLQLACDYVYHMYSLALQDLTGRVEEFKKRRLIIDFNDQVMLLHKAVCSGTVSGCLKSKYDAVFIDEFQDTDREQYEIFSKVFEGKTIFYIGDPKQSIYAWRKADMETYKNARAEVDSAYTMDLNFRSTEKLIGALNAFFSIDNPFYDRGIPYSNVRRGLENPGLMTENNIETDPFEVYGFNNKDHIREFVTSEIKRLLNGNTAKINGHNVKAPDIAVIVRTNAEAAEIKKCLALANIPAITIDNTKVMSTYQARMIRYLMDAVIRPSRGSINRVLLNKCFGISLDLLTKLDEEEHLENFIKLKQVWNDSGIYNMLTEFFDLYKLRHYGLLQEIEGQRTITNFYHIAEILHQRELKSRCTPNELFAWSLRAEDEINEEYEQRIESQEAAVKIATIHKCKGLTFNIVFAPHLDLGVDEKELYDFRENGVYWFTHRPSEDQKVKWHDQIEQENRRLIYVALTRARYKNYVCISNSNQCKGTSIKIFNAFGQKEWTAQDIPQNTLPQPGHGQFVPRKYNGSEIKNESGIHSFSSLNTSHFPVPFEKMIRDEHNYEFFIFQELSRGANTGTALHSIFEKLDFSSEETWMSTLKDRAIYFPGIISEDRIGNFLLMVNHAMNSYVSCNGETFRIRDIRSDRKLAEPEFYFSINNVSKRVLDEILPDDTIIPGDAGIAGLMTGAMDLVFGHRGKYYILDWKSNHLGNSVNDYGYDGMKKAMEDNNYNLQYHIYTVALKRWLESRGIDFYNSFGGVIYVFLRGVREGKNTGIYTAKPGKEIIDNLDNALSGNLQKT